MHELAKVTLLSKEESKFYINKGDDKEHVPTDEFLEKRHARFVIPEDAQETTRKHQEFIKGLNKKKLDNKALPSTNLTMLKKQSTLVMRDAYNSISPMPE